MNIQIDKPEYISVGDLSKGFSENALAPTKELVGKLLTFYTKENMSKVAFKDKNLLEWNVYQGKNEFIYPCIYKAIKLRENIYFIDFIASYGDTKSISIIADMNRQIGLLITGILPTSEQMSVPIFNRAQKGLPLTSVHVNCENVSINKMFSSSMEYFERTDELVGKRIQFTYSSKDIYEHIYLNNHMYTWHCIRGNEIGLCDTDQCYYYKINKKLYLFLWIEKIIPTIGVVLEDLSIMRSFGKIYGYRDYKEGRVTNFSVGSYAKFLNETKYNQ